MSSLNENVNNLLLQLDPNYERCPFCNQLRHKNVIAFSNSLNDQKMCYACIIKEDDKKEQDFKKQELVMKEFEEKYQNNSNFLTSEQTLNEHLP